LSRQPSRQVVQINDRTHAKNDESGHVSGHDVQIKGNQIEKMI